MPSSSSHSVSKKYLRDESFCDGMISTLGHDEAFRGRGFGSIEVGGTSVHLTVMKISIFWPSMSRRTCTFLRIFMPKPEEDGIII